MLAFTPRVAQAADQDDRIDPAGAVVVVLVDQSGSLSSDDLRQELRAVGMLADVPDIQLARHRVCERGQPPCMAGGVRAGT